MKLFVRVVLGAVGMLVGGTLLVIIWAVLAAAVSS
jgi:hypothetical protein